MSLIASSLWCKNNSRPAVNECFCTSWICVWPAATPTRDDSKFNVKKRQQIAQFGEVCNERRAAYEIFVTSMLRCDRYYQLSSEEKKKKKATVEFQRFEASRMWYGKYFSPFMSSSSFRVDYRINLHNFPSRISQLCNATADKYVDKSRNYSSYHCDVNNGCLQSSITSRVYTLIMEKNDRTSDILGWTSWSLIFVNDVRTEKENICEKFYTYIHFDWHSSVSRRH